MDIRCSNCEEIIELPLHTGDVKKVEKCLSCDTNLTFDLYYRCKNCQIFFIKNEFRCPICGRLKKERNKLNIKPNYIYIESENDYNKAINHLDKLDVIGLDTEGNSLDPFMNELLLIQLGNQYISYIFNYRWHDRLSKEPFWEDELKLFIVQNVKYDYKVLKYSCSIILKNVYDTMLAERLLTCGVSRKIGLKDIVKKYLGFEPDKELRADFIKIKQETFDTLISNELLEYSSIDVQVLPLIYELQRKELLYGGMNRIAWLEFNTAKVIAEMELNGIYVDIDKWCSIVEDCKEKKSVLVNQMNNLLKECDVETGFFISINYNSTSKLIEIFRKIGYEVESTNDEALRGIDHPFADLLAEYRKLEKQISSFGESFLEFVRKETGRVHPSFNQIGADTGRFSCTKPNLQQIPSTEEYRSCFSAPKGRKIVTCDYSQQELRLLASLSGDRKFIEMYEQGVDLHSATASLMFGIPLEDVQKDKERKIAKTINFGLAYGQGARSLGKRIGVNEEEAEEMVEKYFSQFSSIRNWLENSAAEAIQMGYTKTLLGRKRFFDIPDENDSVFIQKISAIERKGKNSPIQGNAVDMIKLALVNIYRELTERELDAFLINTVHDEIVVECNEDIADVVAEIVENCMVEAGKALVDNVPILAEACIEDYWTH